MTDKMQTLMDAAYARWQKSNPQWSKQDFWDQLDADERVAVFLGNLNYQVGNGGFSQWWGNNYATPETIGYIKRACAHIGTEAARKVAELVTKFERAVDGRAERDLSEDDWEELSDKLNELDRAFYQIDTQFLADVEAHLARAAGRLVDVVVEVGGRRWKIREARSMEDAQNTIAAARCSGSVEGKDSLDETRTGGGVTVLADVVQINSDGTERQPYTEAH